MSEIMTIRGVECYEVDGTAYLKLGDAEVAGKLFEFYLNL